MNAETLASTVHRAYSVLTVRAANDDERIIEGVATTPTPDSYDDIVEPKGAEFSLPLLGSESIELSPADFRGKPLVLVFGSFT